MLSFRQRLMLASVPFRHRARLFAVRAVHAYGNRMDKWLDQLLIRLNMDEYSEHISRVVVIDDDGWLVFPIDGEENDEYGF